MKQIARILLVVTLLLGGVGSVSAQDEATPEPVVVGTPVLIMPDLPPIAVESGGTLIVNQDPADPVATPREIPESVLLAIVIGVSAFAVIALVLYARHKGITTQQAFQGLPGVIPQHVYPAVWNYRYDLAQRTVDPIDNELLKQEARLFGYRISERSDGSVLIERDPAHMPPAPTTNALG